MVSALHGSRQTSQSWAPAILLLALLPTFTFLGHWQEIFGGAAPAVSALSGSTAGLVDTGPLQADQARHAQHCHIDLGTCTEQPMPSGVGLFVTREQLLLVPPQQFAVRLVEPAMPLLTGAMSPPTPPPRSI